MTLLTDNAERMLAAMDEARVAMVIQLYDNGIIPSLLGMPRRHAIKSLLMDKRVSYIPEGDIDYWLDWFNVT